MPLSKINNKYDLKNLYIFTLFLSIVFAANTSAIFGSLNIRAILFVLISTLFFLHFYGEIIDWLIRSKFSSKFLFFLFLLHPFIIFYLYSLGFKNFELSNISSSQILFRYINILFQICLFIYVFNSFQRKNYLFYFRASLLITIIFFLQYIFIVHSNFPNILLHESLKDFLFRSDQYTALFSLVSLVFVYTMLLKKVKLTYLILFFICLVIIYSSFQRSAMIAAIMFIFLSIITSKSLNSRSLFLLCSSIIIIVIIYYYFLLPRDNLFTIESLLERIVFFTNGLNVFYDYFPYGVGANNNENFLKLNSGTFIEILKNYSLNTDNLLLNKRINIFYDYTDVSTHSTQIDILTDFGLLGLIALILYYYIPLKIILITFRKNDINAVLARNYACGVLSISLFYFMLSNIQLLWINLIIYSYMLFLFKEFKLAYENT